MVTAIEAYCALANQLIYQEQIQIDFIKKRKLYKSDVKKYSLGFSKDDDIIKILHSKGYSKKDLIEYGILIKTKYGLWHPFKNRIIFPIVDTNNTIVGITGRSLKMNDNVKYIHTTNTAHFTKGNTLYLEYLINKNHANIYIVEGPMDAIAMNKRGYNAVATFGTGFSKMQLHKIKEYSKEYEINILFDNDGPGREASLKIIKELSKIACKVNYISMPENYKDIDEFLRNDEVKNLKKRNGRNFFFDNYFKNIFSLETYREAYLEFIKQYKFLTTIEDGRIYRGFLIKLSKLNDLTTKEMEALLNVRRKIND